MSFAKMESKAMPTLACVGVVTSVGEVKAAKSGVYLTTPVEISPYGAGRGIKQYLTFRPEWFTEEFHAAVAEIGSVTEYFAKTCGNEDYVNGKGETKLLANAFPFVYSSNFANNDGTSFIQALFPDDKAFDDFCDKAIALKLSPTEPDLAVLTEFLNEQFNDKVIGYVLTQRRIDSGKVTEDGKKVTIADNNYDVKNVFAPTEKKIKSLQKSSKIKMTFEPEDIPF